MCGISVSYFCCHFVISFRYNNGNPVYSRNSVRYTGNLTINFVEMVSGANNTGSIVTPLTIYAGAFGDTCLNNSSYDISRGDVITDEGVWASLFLKYGTNNIPPQNGMHMDNLRRKTG